MCLSLYLTTISWPYNSWLKHSLSLSLSPSFTHTLIQLPMKRHTSYYWNCPLFLFTHPHFHSLAASRFPWNYVAITNRTVNLPSKHSLGQCTLRHTHAHQQHSVQFVQSMEANVNRMRPLVQFCNSRFWMMEGLRNMFWLVFANFPFYGWFTHFNVRGKGMATIWCAHNYAQFTDTKQTKKNVIFFLFPFIFLVGCSFSSFITQHTDKIQIRSLSILIGIIEQLFFVSHSVHRLLTKVCVHQATK